MLVVDWVRSQVPGPLAAVAEAHGVALVEGVLSHQLKQYVIDGNKCVLARPGPEHRVEDAEFEENEVYAIDIVVRAPSLPPSRQACGCLARLLVLSRLRRVDGCAPAY